MASINVNPDDIANISVNNEESDFSAEYLSRDLANRAYDDVDENEDLLGNTIEETDDRPMVACLAPNDRGGTVLAIFYFLGITTLLPWNFFINADKYWMYKFRDVNNGTSNDTGITSSSSMSWDEDETPDLHSLHGKTHFQASFTSYLAIASNVPSTLCFVVNILISRWISANRRMVISLIITLLFFLVSTVLVKINTDPWQEDFFIITMVSVIFMNSFCAFFQSGLFSIVGRFPSEYTTAVLSGQALGGVFAALANLTSIYFAADQVQSAFIYFLLGTASLLFSVCFSIYLPRILFYKFHMNDKNHQPYHFIENYPPQARIQPNIDGRKSKNLVAIFKKVWIETVSIALVFLVTLAAFPALLVLVVSQDVPSTWNSKYYVPVVSFLVFSLGDFFGRIFAGRLKMPEKSSVWTLIFSLLRVGFLPMIMMCELHPRNRKTLPVVFKTDIEFGIITALFGLSNGYLANIIFLNAPNVVATEDKGDANTVLTTALGIGLSLGVILSCFLVMAL